MKPTPRHHIKIVAPQQQTPIKQLTPEERRAHKRRIEAIRRETERKKQELKVGSINVSVLRSPKVLGGILLVLTILGMAIVSSLDRAPSAQARSVNLRMAQYVENLAIASGRYHFHQGRWPSNLQILAAPASPGWQGPYITRLNRDLWKTPYVYELTNAVAPPLIFSCGPDKQPRTADDIIAPLEAFNVGTAWTNGWDRSSGNHLH